MSSPYQSLNTKKQLPLDKKKSLIFISLLVILCCTIFYQTAKPYQIKKHAPIFNFDTFVYAQYARAWADGHAYRFNQADPPTTGCTSHLYPFILSLFYRMGFQEIHLVDIAYLFNILLFLLSAISYWFIMEKICPGYSLITTLLFILNGQLLLGILGLSEAALFLFFTLMTWCMALYKRYWLMSIFMFILPFIRPEGVIIIVFYGLILFLELILGKKPIKAENIKQRLLVFGIALLGICLVFLLNYLITGMFNFDSVIKKGHFLNNQWLTATTKWIQAIVYNIRTLLFAGDETLRLFYMIPLISGLIIFIGIISLPWDKKKILTHPHHIKLWWLLFFLFSIFMTSYSRTPMLHYDRYLIWVIPLLYPFLIWGIDILPLRGNIKKGFLIFFILFQLFSFPLFVKNYVNDCGKFKSILVELQKPNPLIGKQGKIGVFSGSGLKYFHKDWHIINMGGVTSPYFRNCKSDAQRIKMIQYHPNLQFKHLLYFSGISEKMVKPPKPSYTQPVFEKVLIPYEITYYLDEINWNQLLVGIQPLYTEIQDLLKDKRLIDKLDIGYTKDVNRCSYKIHSKYPYTLSFPFLTKLEIDKSKRIDAAVGVLGYDQFVFKTIPKKDHWLVARTLLTENILLQNLQGINKLGINTKQIKYLLLKIEDIHEVKINLLPFHKGNNLVEWIIKIPGNVILKNKTAFYLFGDHIVCDYWLYVSP